MVRFPYTAEEWKTFPTFDLNKLEIIDGYFATYMDPFLKECGVQECTLKFEIGGECSLYKRRVLRLLYAFDLKKFEEVDDSFATYMDPFLKQRAVIEFVLKV